MTLRQYLILMSICALFCWLSWFLILLYFDPGQTNFIGFIFFYLSLFLSLTGTFSIIGLIIRLKFLKDQLVFKQVSNALRQSILFSFLIIGSLFLKSKNILTWWNIILFILALTILEFFFLSFKKQIPH